MKKISSYIRRLIKFVLSGEPKMSIKADIKLLSPNGRLAGKNIVVTGGGRGIGYAIAKKIVAEGANVLIAGRNEETLKISADELHCNYIKVDVQCVSDFGSFIQAADGILGRIDCVVNNAGISLHEKSFFDVTIDSYDKQMNTNLRSCVFLSQAFLNYVLERKIDNASLLLISSEVGELADNRPYGWTKAAINSLVKGLASNFAKDGIRVNAISPGITCTDMTGFKSDENLFVRTNATNRAYLPEEVAEVACFLLSDCSKCLSGQIIVCNNGKTIYTREKIERNG